MYHCIHKDQTTRRTANVHVSSQSAIIIIARRGLLRPGMVITAYCVANSLAFSSRLRCTSTDPSVLLAEKNWAGNSGGLDSWKVLEAAGTKGGGGARKEQRNDGPRGE